MERFIFNWKEFLAESQVSSSVTRFTLSDICEDLGQSYGDSSDCKELQELYGIFRASYEKATGSAWSEELFIRKAKRWIFFGALGYNGGVVAIRRQNSGLNKLVAVAGNPRTVLRAMNLLSSELEGEAVWGAISEDLVPIAERKGLMTIPGFVKKVAESSILTKFLPINTIIATFIKVLVSSIPKSVFGGYNLKPNPDGSMEVDIAEIGKVKKYIVGNDNYYRSVLTNSEFMGRLESMDKTDPAVSMAINMLKKFFNM